MLVRSDRLELLASPAFIVALALLVLNDFALKPLFHNALTGKVSDFAGLFALTLFVMTLWPRQGRVAALAIAAAFTFWKTSYAEPLIEWLNVTLPFALGRVVDLTDLSALPMIPLAIWTAPRLAACPLPRVIQLALVVVALVAFTATSRARYLARSTMDVTRAVAVDDAELQGLFDEIAVERGLGCEVCVPLSEGRLYVPEGDSDVRALFIKLDPGQTLSFTVSGYDRERGVRVLARRIRNEIEHQFPSIAVLDFTADHLSAVEGGMTIFVVRGFGQTTEAAEQAKRVLSAIVENVARAHGLRDAAKPVQYHTGDGFEPAYSSLVLTPILEAEGLQVRVAVRSAKLEELQGEVTEDLAARLADAFGRENVTRHYHPSMPVEWVY
jgi:hypothetical protein